MLLKFSLNINSIWYNIFDFYSTMGENGVCLMPFSQERPIQDSGNIDGYSARWRSRTKDFNDLRLKLA